jgi:hypothetical protein
MQNAVSWALTSCSLRNRRRSRYVPSKRQRKSTRLHGTTAQKTRAGNPWDMGNSAFRCWNEHHYRYEISGEGPGDGPVRKRVATENDQHLNPLPLSPAPFIDEGARCVVDKRTGNDGKKQFSESGCPPC